MNESRTDETTTGGGAVGRTWTSGGRRRTLGLWLGCALLVGCQGGSATPSATAGPGTSPLASPTGPSPSGIATAIPTSNPTATPTASPTAAPTAPIAQVTFNEMELDAQAGPEAQARTFTFTTDGNGPVSVAVVKNKNLSDSTKLCLAVDGGTPTCQSGQLPSIPVTQATTPHSTWVVTAISAGNATTPIVDVAMSWPTNNPHIKLQHGRLQGSMSPGVPEELNGFNVTFNPRGPGNFTVSSKWTVILTYIDVVLYDVTSMPWVNLYEHLFDGGGSGVQQVSYTTTVDHSKTYRFTLRDTQADNYRPDLTAEVSFP